MAILRETYVLIGQFGPNDAYFVAQQLWDEALKAEADGSRTHTQEAGLPAPAAFSLPTTVVVDDYTIPTDPQAPGYVAGKEGWYRKVYHNGTGGAAFDDTEEAACDLAISQVQGIAPTSRGGFGYISLMLASSAITVGLTVRRAADGSVFGILASQPPGRLRITNVPPGAYLLEAGDLRGCTLPQQPVTVPAFQKLGCTTEGATNYDPDATDDDGTCVFAPADWYAVGGLQPLPVALPVPVVLTDADGVARQGLHVEVELASAGLGTFAAFRRTIRTAADTVDAAPYLRSPLVTQLRYAPRTGAQADPDASLPFTYRYRAVDSTGPGPWVDRLLTRYAVLAAPDGSDSTLRGYTASTTSAAASVSAFPRPTQFVGLPYEVTLLVPADITGPLYCQLRYLDGLRQELEIRCVYLPDDVRGGVVRVALPDNPLPCAAFVEAALVDENHAYEGQCLGGATTPTLPPGYIQLPGRLKLG